MVIEPVQSLWVGTFSPLERLCMVSFVQQGHPFHVYMYEPQPVPEGVTVLDANEIVPYQHLSRFQNLANFSDYFRYNLLFKKGNWWADLDVCCLQPFLFAGPYVLATQLVVQRTNDEVTSCVIHAPKEDLLLEWCLERIAHIDTLTCSWSAIGPALLLEASHRLRLRSYVQPHETFCPIHFFEAPGNVYGPMSGLFKFDLRRTKAVHLWHEESRRKAIDKNARYPGSLYERLQQEIGGDAF